MRGGTDGTESRSNSKTGRSFTTQHDLNTWFMEISNAKANIPFTDRDDQSTQDDSQLQARQRTKQSNEPENIEHTPSNVETSDNEFDVEPNDLDIELEDVNKLETIY